jgi:galactokinase
MVAAAKVKERVRSLYGDAAHKAARVYRAPGRVNLIGEHTDYNDGFVMPVAIDLYTWVALVPRDDRAAELHSENYSETVGFDLDDTAARARGHWSDYPRGVALVLERAGHRLRGANMLIRGEVPIGSGLGSSAAIEVAVGYALLDNSGASIERMDLAKLCRRAENEFVGTRCGLMDQFISCCGRAGHALMLDCRSLDYKPLPLPEGVRIVVCDTTVKHELACSQYNARRAECEEGVARLRKPLPGVRALRDVTVDELERFGRDLPPVIYRRCRHVVGENARVIAAMHALERGELCAFGRLMRESHRSLRDDYEVSCRELDIMVELAGGLEGVYGARMTGAGFGGCTVNLVRAADVASFTRKMSAGYEEATGLMPGIYVCSPAHGVKQVGVE